MNKNIKLLPIFREIKDKKLILNEKLLDKPDTIEGNFIIRFKDKGKIVFQAGKETKLTGKEYSLYLVTDDYDEFFIDIELKTILTKRISLKEAEKKDIVNIKL